MSHEKIDFISFPGKVHLIDSDAKLATLENLKDVKEFGFDTETRPSFKKGEVYKVSLLQLATETDAYLVRLLKITKYDLLKKIFEDADVLKVGVAIAHDLKILQKTFTFMPKNFIELQKVAKEKGIQNMGLKGMTEEVLKAPLTKGPKLTNWEAHELTEKQLMYAATDAWIGLKLYHAIR